MIIDHQNPSNSSNFSELFVSIPKGTIDLNDDRTHKKWKVNIEDFLMAKHPVTQDLFFNITKNNPSTFIGDQLPVETITWKDAISFCNQLSAKLGLASCYSLDPLFEQISFDPTANGYRLPTEAEWQYACQANTQSIRYNEIDKIAWYKSNADNKTHIVGQKEPNEWGLYDMLGNVWEWCSDIYDETEYGSYRIFRGGGWCDQERSVMATNRRRSHPLQFKIDDLGFRIAKNKY